MEVIKRKISIDNFISRDKNTWGVITADTISINVFFIQDSDDMGIGTDEPFIEKNGSKADYQPLISKLALSGLTFQFMNGTTTNVAETGYSPNTRYPNKDKVDYYINGNTVTGLTEDRLTLVSSYDNTQKYKPGFFINKSDNINFKNIQYQDGSRVLTNNNLVPITYIIDGDRNETINISNPKPEIGIHFKTNTGSTRTITGTIFPPYNIPYTEFNYKGQGFNDTNSTLSATTKEEYLFGITESPTVESDLFIDRGATTVIQSHMQLSEIKNMSDLINYGNGYYKIEN